MYLLLSHTSMCCTSIGEFEYVETTDSNGVNIKIYTPLNKRDEGHFAKNVCKKAKINIIYYF